MEIHRNAEGKLIIISRKDCKNEHVFNEKIFKNKLNYVSKVKNVYLNNNKLKQPYDD